jgi:ADP-ribose pyrophosphatase
MRDAELLDTKVLLDKPKRWVREQLCLADGDVVLVRQYRHNLKRDTLELPAGIVSRGEDLEAAALRELVEETGHELTAGGSLHPLGACYARPSETAGYSHLFLATPVQATGTAQLDTEIERYFDMSVVTMPLTSAIAEVGRSIDGLETIGGLMLAQRQLAHRGVGQ